MAGRDLSALAGLCAHLFARWIQQVYRRIFGETSIEAAKDKKTSVRWCKAGAPRTWLRLDGSLCGGDRCQRVRCLLFSLRPEDLDAPLEVGPIFDGNSGSD